MNATHTTTTVNSIDWACVRELARRVAAAMLSGAPNAGADAEDIAQTVAEELWRNVQKGFTPASVDAVVRNMTRQRVFDGWKKKGRWDKVMVISADQQAEVGVEHTTNTPSPEAQLIARQLGQHVARSLLSLPRKQARLWAARRFDGMSSDELGQRENMSQSAVDAAISRAGTKLRALMNAESSRAAPSVAARPDALGRLFDGLLATARVLVVLRRWSHSLSLRLRVPVGAFA